MAKQVEVEEITVDDALDELKSAFNNFLDAIVENAGGSTGSDDESDDEDEGDDDELEPLDQEETEALPIKELRTLAKTYGVDATKKADILEGLSEFYADDDEDEDEEDDEDEDEEGYTRDELEELDIKTLRKTAKEEGHDASEIRGLDQDALIELILGDEDEEDEDEEDEDGDEDDDDEETEELDEDALNDMSQKELTDLAKELGIKVKIPASAKTAAKKKAHLVKTILDSGEED